MNETKRDPLDAALASLPRDVQPAHDLWPQIRAEMDAAPALGPSAARTFPSRTWFQLAAGVLLVLASSLTTFVLTRQSVESEQPLVQELQPAPLASAMPASFGPEALGAEYLKARAALGDVFEQRLATLPPATRAKLERNLADLRHAASEISATLAQHPSDPLLQELLLSTYQSELQLLADVNEMTTTRSTRADL